MKAVIMAGGEGTRLRPLTCDRPKPMVPIVNKPVMEHIVELLKKHNITDIAVTLLYMPEAIENYFGDGRNFGVNMEYYVETIPLGTAGSVKNAEDFLNDTFIVISGDALTDINLDKALEFHFKKGSIATLLLKRVTVPLEYGIVVTDEEGRITRFLEKPSWGEVFSDTANTGIYILSPTVLNFFNKNELFDFSRDLFPILLREKLPLYGYVTEDYWCDIGDPGAYIQSHIDILDGKVGISIPGREIREKVWADEGAVISASAEIKAPCIIGKHTEIKDNCYIGEYSVIGESNTFESYSSIKRSIIWNNCLIDNNVELRGSVLCNKVHFLSSSKAFENSVIGDGTIIKNKATIRPNIKIWPEKLIDENTEINSNLVWGTKYTRNIFGNRGVAGEINVDITPEYASKLGAAYGGIFKKKGIIGVSSDKDPASKMIKSSLTAGILTTGVKIKDFGEMLLPVARSAVRFYNTEGGIHIATSHYNSKRLFINIMDSKGCNISRDLERKIENIFIREDFARCEGDCIGDIEFVPNYDSFYLRDIINKVQTKKMEYKIALNTEPTYAIGIMKNLLTQLCCEVELIDTKGINDVNFFTNWVKDKNFDLGVLVDDLAEKLTLVDNRGRIITEDAYMALIAIMLFKTVNGGTMVVPISASHILEEIAKKYDGRIIRTKTSTRDVMYKLMSNSKEEGMLDQFTLHFDAVAGLTKVLDFMKCYNYRLSDIVDMIPAFHIDKKEVECPWNAKGKVMRQIIREQTGNVIETMEGVKLYNDNGWVLILPDAESPVCKVISEGYSQEFAEELSSFYADKIRKISRGE